MGPIPVQKWKGMSSLTKLHMQWLRGPKMTPSISIRICPILGTALPLSETWIHKLPNWLNWDTQWDLLKMISKYQHHSIPWGIARHLL